MKCAAIPGAPRVAMMRLSAIEQRKCAFESLAEFSLEPAQGMDQRSSGSPRWGEGGNRRRSDGELLPEGRGHAPAFWSGRGAGPSPGADGYGIYAYAMALVGLMQVPVQLGLPNLLVREVAAYREKGEWGLLRGLLARVNQGVASLAVLAGLGAFGATWVYAEVRGEPTWLPAFWVALFLIPLGSLSALSQATLRGLRHVILGQIPEFLARPALAFL